MSYFEVFVRKIVLSICPIIAFVGLLPNAFAEASSASLSVTITDPSGAVVPNADVTLRCTDTNQEQHSQTQGIGSATFSFLQPGHYMVLVSKAISLTSPSTTSC